MRSTRDATARGRDGVAASFRPWEGLNPRSVLLGPARDAGITSAVMMPQGGLISGQAAMLHLVDGSVADMVLRAPIGMVATIGPASGATGLPRAETMSKLREILDDARVYRTRRADFERAQTRTVRREPARSRGAAARARRQASDDRQRRQGERHRGGTQARQNEFKFKLIIGGRRRSVEGRRQARRRRRFRCSPAR